jgi:N-acetylmuramoyl-L-alanine amidase
MQTPPKPLVVVGALALALAAGSVLVGSAAATDRVVIVQPGQTLSEIAMEQGVTVHHLVAVNGIANPDRIFAGQRLVIASAAPTSAPAPVPVAPAPATHQVARGETLTGIAARYGTSIAALASANGIGNPSYIRAGQVLAIPGAPAAQPAAAAPPAAAPASHQVASGETLSDIAVRYGTSVMALASANGIVNPSFIRVGQVLVIPAGAAATPAAPSSGGAPMSMGALMAQRDGVRQLIVAEATAQGVPPAIALAVAWQESGWQQGVVSYAGAIGVMQLIPASGEWVAQSMLGQPVNLYDAGSNVRAGVRLLRHYLDRYAGDRALALAAYYQGQAATDRHGIYPVSRPYIASILQLEQILSR